MVKKFLRFIPALLWMMIIFYFSAQDTSSTTTFQINKFIFFKTLHLIEYAIFGILLSFAFQNNKNTLKTGYIYALTDEIHQSFTPNREARLTDTLIDLLGIVIGLCIIKLIKRKK